MEEGFMKASGIRFASLDSAGTELGDSRVLIVTDPEVRRLYGDRLPPYPAIEVPRGEAAKNLDMLAILYEGFLERSLDRGSTILALGGGSISDLAGFAAATWLRGLDFGIVPTTLLAMVDAAIGGKNGVDFRGRKNLIGTIAQPRFVLIDVGLLDTLPDVQFSSGMAEVIKHGIISGEDHFSFLEEGCSSRRALGRGRLEELVRRSVELKTSIVALDERESGRRRVLNLGHTIGHGIEAATGLPHGHCVAAGIVSAFRLAESRGIPARGRERVESLLAAWSLPRSIDEARELARELRVSPSGNDAGIGEIELRSVIVEAIAADKKRSADAILFALPAGIGDVRIEAVTLEELRTFIREAP